MTRTFSAKTALVPMLALLLLGITARLIELPANFSPTAAIVLFAGFYFRERWAAALIGIGALAVSDLVLGSYEPGLMAAVYLAMLFPIVLRGWLRARLSPWRIGGAAVASSAVFFLVTNLAVWAFSGGYPPNLAGLVECYVAALPFDQHSLIGDLVWSAALFGTYAAVLGTDSDRNTHLA